MTDATEWPFEIKAISRFRWRQNPAAHPERVARMAKRIREVSYLKYRENTNVVDLSKMGVLTG